MCILAGNTCINFRPDENFIILRVVLTAVAKFHNTSRYESSAAARPRCWSRSSSRHRRSTRCWSRSCSSASHAGQGAPRGAGARPGTGPGAWRGDASRAEGRKRADGEGPGAGASAGSGRGPRAVAPARAEGLEQELRWPLAESLEQEICTTKLTRGLRSWVDRGQVRRSWGGGIVGRCGDHGEVGSWAGEEITASWNRGQELGSRRAGIAGKSWDHGMGKGIAGITTLLYFGTEGVHCSLLARSIKSS
ncbi:fibroin heavy chain-like [Hordeum vulgare subsp. vulgare]|uniref:fibroin heavy chain-like n=1 Tax=Hordeum vulgare subsp. vulgare TaxID=112509 RepID=UPI001D1A5821|nr:fibroin heavy chain-like [Hordeum vulgare subsp. vulgare]